MQEERRNLSKRFLLDEGAQKFSKKVGNTSPARVFERKIMKRKGNGFKKAIPLNRINTVF